MPKIKEAAVAVTGMVLDIEHLSNFETKKLDGSLKVLINTGDGFASVKVHPEDAHAASVAEGLRVAWVVRFGAYQRGDSDAQATCRFIRTVTEDDLDRLVSATQTAPASGK